MLPKEVTDYLALLFTASLTFEAVLFGVFGILYSVYALYSAAATPEHPVRAPICTNLKWLCRLLGIVMLLDAAPTIYPLYALTLSSVVYEILASILATSILSMVGLTLIVAFGLME